MKNLSLLSAVLMLFTVVLIALKEALFSIKSGYAPHEFKFTYTVIFPIIVVCFFLSSIVFVKWLRIKKNRIGWPLIYLLISLPGFIFGLLYILVTIFILFG